MIWGRRAFVVLAALAMLVGVLSPQGFMIVSGKSGLPEVVACTGHGPMMSMRADKAPAHPPTLRHDAPCVFAGHGVSTTPSVSIPFEQRLVVWTASPPALLLSHGVTNPSLAAPPPPSQAPPAHLA
jgi:hypothetical protein